MPPRKPAPAAGATPPCSRRRLRMAAGIAAALAVTGCARDPGGLPWREEMRAWFNNGSLRPEDPSPAYWTRSAEELFLRRIGFADVTLVGRIKRSTLFSDLAVPRTLTISIAPEEVLHGDVRPFLDDDGEVVLHLDAAADDFGPALRALREVEDTRFLLLIKRLPAPRGARAAYGGWRASLGAPAAAARRPAYRWALYYADPALVGHVRALYALYHRRAKR